MTDKRRQWQQKDTQQHSNNAVKGENISVYFSKSPLPEKENKEKGEKITTEQRGKTTAQSINMHHQKCIAEQKNVYRGYSGSRVEQTHSEKCGVS